MKGVSRFVAYVLTILFGFTVLISFSMIIYGYYDRILRVNVRASLKQIAEQTSSSVVNLYSMAEKSDVQPSNSSSITISSIDLNYPSKVGGKNFKVSLVSASDLWVQVDNVTVSGKVVTIRKEYSSGAKVVAETTQKPIVRYEHDVPNLPVSLQGSFRSGEDDLLRYVRYNYNGTINDAIIVGEPSLVVDITSMS